MNYVCNYVDQLKHGEGQFTHFILTFHHYE